MVSELDLISDAQFTEIVEKSSTVSEVLKTLGYSVNGNSWGFHIVNDRMNKLGITFKKKFKINTKVPKEKAKIEKLLTENSDYNRHKLKKRLVEEGILEYKCDICGISEWQGQPISLQLHHRNGIHNDNRLCNIQLLCPNCHSQTENFSTKGKGRIIIKKCEELPLQDREKILTTVKELGIVEARKQLPYRNSLINRIVKLHKEILIMHAPDGDRKFNTTYEAAKCLYEKYNMGSSVYSLRASISKCINGHQKSIKGITFEKRSMTE